ncbi:MAG: class I SAM-dependent methyltransferase [Pleurocapsa sp. SU_196_0]|nr:class I SAM-dependent methyltransferase [Pleurocapsa sp. SU_196_0]
MQNAQPFTSLARVYDAIFSDVEYDDWCAFTIDQLATDWAGATLEPAEVRVLDLACGTGSSTVPYVGCGYAVTGVDLSAQMLEVAREKLSGVNFVQQNFLELTLPERFHLVTCVFDSLNNLTDAADLERAFARVYAHLESGGWFVFDCNTRLGVRDLWDDGRFEGEAITDGGSVRFLWEHEFLEETGLGQVTATCWGDGFSFSEVHLERGYDPAELSAMLERVGFADVRCVEYPDAAVPTPDSPRVWVFASKK